MYLMWQYCRVDKEETARKPRLIKSRAFQKQYTVKNNTYLIIFNIQTTFK